MIPQATLLRIVREVVVPPPLLSLRSALVLAQQWPAALASKGDPPLPHLAVQPAAKAALLPPAPPMISSAMAAATSLSKDRLALLRLFRRWRHSRSPRSPLQDLVLSAAPKSRLPLRRAVRLPCRYLAVCADTPAACAGRLLKVALILDVGCVRGCEGTNGGPRKV